MSSSSNRLFCVATSWLPSGLANRLWITLVWAKNLTKARRAGSTGHLHLDQGLHAFIEPERSGFFVEAGAADGVSQSPTYFLEKKYGWKGLLVEPHGFQARLARLSRASKVIQCALVPKSFAGRTTVLNAAGLMGTIHEPPKEEAFTLQALQPETQLVAVNDIESLVSAHKPNHDQYRLLVLDLEGYELEVLQDLGNWQHLPEYICLETVNFSIEEVTSMIGHRYQFVDWLTDQDTLWLHRG